MAFLNSISKLVGKAKAAAPDSASQGYVREVSQRLHLTDARFLADSIGEPGGAKVYWVLGVWWFIR